MTLSAEKPFRPFNKNLIQKSERFDLYVYAKFHVSRFKFLEEETNLRMQWETLKIVIGDCDYTEELAKEPNWELVW